MSFKAFYIFAFLILHQLCSTFGQSKMIEWRVIKRLNRRQSSICIGHGVGEFVRNPEDCKLFYLCLENGEAVVASCPPTMLFNPDSKLCDSSANVVCNTATTNGPNTSAASMTTTTTTTTLATTVDSGLEARRYCATLSPQQDRIAFIGSSSNCQQYYVCYYGQAILQECSANLNWNANIGKCDLPENANCQVNGNTANNGNNSGNNNGNNNGNNSGNNNGNNSGNNNGNNNGNDIGELINCPVYGQHIFPHMRRCDFFVYCVKGHAILQQCPFYYHFDVVAKSCKWRTAATCVRDLNINIKRFAQI